MATNVAQPERSNIKYYALAFSNTSRDSCMIIFL